MKFITTLLVAAAMALGAADAVFAQMTEYETKMLAVHEKSLEQNRITAAYQRCAASKTMMPFIFLDVCLASFGVTQPDAKLAVSSQASSCDGMRSPTPCR